MGRIAACAALVVLAALGAGCELILVADKVDQVEDDLDQPTAELDADGPVLEVAPGAIAEVEIHIMSDRTFRDADATLTGSTRALADGAAPSFTLELEEYECVSTDCRGVAFQRFLYAGDTLDLSGRLTCEGDCNQLLSVLRVELPASSPVGLEVVWAIEMRIDGIEEEDASLVIEPR